MMKRISVLLFVAMCAGAVWGQEDANTNNSDTNKKMPFEHGSYVQVMNMVGIGNGEVMEVKIIQTVYFDRWGEWIATEVQSETNTIDTTKIHKLNILKGNTYWDIDLIKKTGDVLEVPIEMIKTLTNWENTFTSTGMFGAGMKMKELGEEEYLGYNCKKTQIKYAPVEPKNRKQKKKQVKNPSMTMESTTLTYGNLTMKMDMKLNIEAMNMEMSLKTISINLDAPPASVFEVPGDVKIESVDWKIEE